MIICVENGEWPDPSLRISLCPFTPREGSPCIAKRQLKAMASFVGKRQRGDGDLRNIALPPIQTDFKGRIDVELGARRPAHPQYPLVLLPMGNSEKLAKIGLEEL